MKYLIFLLLLPLVLAQDCGNNEEDFGENCANCPQDIKCPEGFSCIDDVCRREVTGATASKIFTYALIIFIIAALTIFSMKKIQERRIFGPPKASGKKLDSRLVEYIRKCILRKIPKKTIMKTLLNAGWSEEQVKEAFRKAK